MAARMDYSARESYWDKQRDSLSGIRDQLSVTPSPLFQPLSDRHPLLQGSSSHRGATPPTQLPRLDTAPVFQQPASSLRGSKYDIVPPVKPRQAFSSPNGYDSWGEEGGSDSENEAGFPPQYSYPYPVVMYPMVVPPNHLRGRSRKTKEDSQSRKKVRYRDTPVYLNSRDHTKHAPDWTRSQHTTGGDSQRFRYINTDSKYNPFDPRSNSVLARYQYPSDGTLLADDILRDRGLLKDEDPYTYFTTNPMFAFKFVDDFIGRHLENELVPDVLIDVISRQSDKQSLQRSLELSGPVYTRADPLKDFLDDLLDDVVMEEGILAVRSSVHQLVDEHLVRSATHDILGELATEEVQFFGPDLVREAIFENIVEDIIDEEIIDPEVRPVARVVAKETLEHYDNKARRQEIRQLKRHSGNKALDAYCLDFLLSMVARQGILWNQGEQANLFFDSMVLNIVLEQYLDVGHKRTATVDNKPVRRMHEKIVTDEAVEVLLTELCQTLDEDMADLDEYECGLELSLNLNNTTNNSDLQRWLEGR